MPIGDGGEGTLDALAENLNLEKKSIKIPHTYTSDGSVSFASNGQTAVFEMAAVFWCCDIVGGDWNAFYFGGFVCLLVRSVMK